MEIVFFKKKEINKYTWIRVANGRVIEKALMDYVLITKRMVGRLKDVHVFRGVAAGMSDHFLVEAEVVVAKEWGNRVVGCSDVNGFFPVEKKLFFFRKKTTKIKKTFFFLVSRINCPWAICTLQKMFPHSWNICIVLCLAIFTFYHIFIVYFLSFKVYPHFTKGFCPPHVYSPIANLLLTLFPYCK